MPGCSPRRAAPVGEREVTRAAAPPGPRLTARGVLAAAALALLLAFPIVRVSVADRTPLRGAAVHGLWFEKTKVDPGQTVTRQLSWTPEQDVYIVGWNPLLLAPPEASYLVELTLSDGQTRLFVMAAAGSRPGDAGEIGRASCRERGEMWGGDGW